VPLFAELRRRHPRDNRYKSLRSAAEAFCAYEEKRFTDGLRLVGRAEQGQQLGGLLDPLALFMANQLEDGRESVARLRKLADSGAIATIPIEILWWSARVIAHDGLTAESDAVAYQVATSGAFLGMDPKVQGFWASGALNHAARTGETQHVDALLRYVRSPSAVIDLLGQRDYERIWPQVEAYAGDNLAGLSDDYVAWTASRLAAKPEDRDRMSEQSYALLYAGRFREAVALAEDALARHEGAIEEGDAWALNIEAYAYDALGQPAAADRVLDRLAGLSAEAHPWVVNFVINRETRLVELARWEEAVAASEVAKPVAAQYGSPYARMLVAGDRACAFHKLGRTAESERELQFVREHVDDAPTAAGEALLCAGLEDEAVRTLTRVLQEGKARSALLSDLQDVRFSLFGSPATNLPKPRDLLASHADFREQALKYMRIIPERFVPIAYSRRQQLSAQASH
jgi:hypothetical protein